MRSLREYGSLPSCRDHNSVPCLNKGPNFMTSKLGNSLEFDKMPNERFTLLLKTIVLVVKEEQLSFWNPSFYKKLNKIKQGNLEHKPAPEAVPRKHNPGGCTWSRGAALVYGIPSFSAFSLWLCVGLQAAMGCSWLNHKAQHVFV